MGRPQAPRSAPAFSAAPAVWTAPGSPATADRLDHGSSPFRGGGQPCARAPRLPSRITPQMLRWWRRMDDRPPWRCSGKGGDTVCMRSLTGAPIERARKSDLLCNILVSCSGHSTIPRCWQKTGARCFGRADDPLRAASAALRAGGRAGWWPSRHGLRGRRVAGRRGRRPPALRAERARWASQWRSAL
jgi:hypothetical protein